MGNLCSSELSPRATPGGAHHDPKEKVQGGGHSAQPDVVPE